MNLWIIRKKLNAICFENASILSVDNSTKVKLPMILTLASMNVSPSTSSLNNA